MATKKIWNLFYIAGNPDIFSNVVKDRSSPMLRSDALEAAQRLGEKGWRTWVVHAETNKRIFESQAEINTHSG